MHRNQKLFLMLAFLSSTVALLYYHWFAVKYSVVRQDLSLNVHVPQVLTQAEDVIIPESKRGFVTALRYSGQQGSGIKALKSLQCFVSLFNSTLRILEPTIVGGTLVADLTSAKSRSSAVKLSSVFDISHINQQAYEYNLAQLTAREHFLSQAPKNIVMVIMKWVSRRVPDTERNMEVVWPGSTNIQPNECFDIQTSPKEWQKHLASLPTGFCVVKVIQAPFSPARRKIFSEEEARSVIYGKLLPSKVTTIFSLWREGWFSPPTSNSTKVVECPTLNFYKPSKEVLNRATWYEKKYLGGRATLSIMFRLERMVEFLHDSPQIDIETCLTRVEYLTNQVQSGHSQFSKPFLTLDFGDSGSTSWENTVSHYALNLTELIYKTKKIISKIFDGEWNLKTWESTFTNATEGITDPGYIAALQRTIASRSTCLILVGGGHFQSIAMNDYLRDHPDSSQQCIHFVCAKEYLTKLNDSA